MGGPELELGVARCSELDEVFFAAIVHLDTGHGLRVAAIEGFGETQDGGQRAHGFALPAAERAETFMRLFRRRLAVVTRDERDDFGFSRLEAP